MSKSVRPAASSSSPSTLTDDRCDVCGKNGVTVRLVTRSFGTRDALLVIEDIPMTTCPHCGSSYFAARTLHEIERIKTLRQSVAVAREVPVARFKVDAS